MTCAVFAVKLTGMYAPVGRFENIFMTYFQTLYGHEIWSIIEDEDEPVALFVEPHDGYVSDEDSADNDDGLLVNILTGNQVNAPAEAVFPEE